jgi:fumarate hydratase class II
LGQALAQKARRFDNIVKIGRTHLNDATPIRLGQEFGGYARQIELSRARINEAANGLEELPLGGTAVGTGINSHPQFARRAIRTIAEMTGLTPRPKSFEAQAEKTPWSTRAAR